MASYLDARAHGGKWLVRMEDIDEARVMPGSADAILDSLKALGMLWDGEVVWQSRRKPLYEAAFKQLGNHVYACGCTRKEIADSQIGVASDGASIYPGICRKGLASGKAPRSFRLRVPDESDQRGHIEFMDRWAGSQTQDLNRSVGDFVLKRADGFWAYQLAVVVDDADQGVTHVVRGVDLHESTARQIYLQRLLGLPTPEYLHVPVVTNARGEKLSKQTGAAALNTAQPIPALLQAAGFLQLPVDGADSVAQFWEQAIACWTHRFGATAFP
jgi:glutamyl-Q tRNA(Asp) synthetase